MKNRICLIVFITILSVSCKKEFKPQTVDQVVVLMKNDIEMKELYNASKSWVIMTSIDVKKRRFDSAATVAYLQHFKSVEQDRLLRIAESIKLKYKFHLYPIEQKKQMIAETFRHFMAVEDAEFRRQAESAKFEEPIQPDDDILLPYLPKDCYKYLIEDVSNCDRDMVIDSGFSLFGLFSGPLTYFIAQAAAFVKHSNCVDDAHEAYRRCKSKTQLYDPETSIISDGIIQIWNPDNPADFIIIYEGQE